MSIGYEDYLKERLQKLLLRFILDFQDQFQPLETRLFYKTRYFDVIL